MNNKIRQFSYRDLPKRVYNIEEKVKEIEDGGDVTAHSHDITDINGLEYELSFKVKKNDLSTVATSGNYNDLSNKPAILTIGTTATTAKAGNYQPTWAQVTGKPTTFAPAAHTHAWVDITDKPAIIASGATQAEARTAIGAGTGNSNLAIGTTASTAKAGNYTPSATEVVNALNAMTPEQIGEIQTLLGITPA